jgi:hypothetical protein
MFTHSTLSNTLFKTIQNRKRRVVFSKSHLLQGGREIARNLHHAMMCNDSFDSRKTSANSRNFIGILGCLLRVELARFVYI